MTLHEQVKYMLSVSTAVIALSVSIVFSPWTSAALNVLIKTPILFFLVYTGTQATWRKCIGSHDYVEEKNEEMTNWIHGHGKRAWHRKVEKRAQRKEKDAEMSKNGAVFQLAAATLYGHTIETKSKNRRWPSMRLGINEKTARGFTPGGASSSLGGRELDIERGQ